MARKHGEKDEAEREQTTDRWRHLSVVQVVGGLNSNSELLRPRKFREGRRGQVFAAEYLDQDPGRG